MFQFESLFMNVSIRKIECLDSAIFLYSVGHLNREFINVHVHVPIILILKE